jgi:RimJ/RimL family protein N-acetyltransferase
MKVLDTIDDRKLTVYQSDNIVSTSPFNLMFECYMEIVAQGWTTLGIPFRNSNSVIWIENDLRQVMGGICYEIIDDRKEGWINLNFTSSDFRGQGINAIAHEYFESICRSRGMRHIGCVVHKDNVNSIQSCKKVGFKSDFYRMIKDIK